MRQGKWEKIKGNVIRLWVMCVRGGNGDRSTDNGVNGKSNSDKKYA